MVALCTKKNIIFIFYHLIISYQIRHLRTYGNIFIKIMKALVTRGYWFRASVTPTAIFLPTSFNHLNNMFGDFLEKDF